MRFANSLRMFAAAAAMALLAAASAQTFDEGWGGITPSVQPGTTPETSAPAPVSPAPTPQQPAAPVAGDITQALQGAWMGTDGRQTLLIIFQGNNCGFALNNQQTFGAWSVQGDRLNLSFQNGKSVSYQFVLSGNTLILDGTIRLQRQNMPAQGGGTGPVSAPVPGPSASACPVEGDWVMDLPNGQQAMMRFRGSTYTFLVGGQQLEAGTFYCQGDKLHYTVTQGAQAGTSGTNTIVMQGSRLSIIPPNGQGMTFTRSGGRTAQPAAASGTTPLEGRWLSAANSRQHFLVMVFRGNKSYAYYNGSLLETARIEYRNGQLIQHMLTGSAAGTRVVSLCRIAGNRMTLQIPGRVTTVWIRSRR